jgi:hypothetical protein
MLRKPNSPKLVAAACGALVMLGLAAPSAMAAPGSTVNRTEDAPGRFTLRVDARPGVSNVLKLTHDGGYISVTDNGADGPFATGGGCTAVSTLPPLVACPDTASRPSSSSSATRTTAGPTTAT